MGGRSDHDDHYDHGGYGGVLTRKEFTKELGRLGRQMMKNRFVSDPSPVKSAQDLKMKLSLRGEKILPFERRSSPYAPKKSFNKVHVLFLEFEFFIKGV